MSESSITAERAQIAVQRLINSIFNTKDQARCSIPARADDDDLVAAAYIEQSAECIAKLEAKNAALREQVRALDESVSNEQENVRLRAKVEDLQRELRQERGLKALLANGMPPTENPDFDEILATHPVAAMIQRGWLPGITGFDDLPALESAICHFWGVATIAEAVNPEMRRRKRARKAGA